VWFLFVWCLSTIIKCLRLQSFEHFSFSAYVSGGWVGKTAVASEWSSTYFYRSPLYVTNLGFLIAWNLSVGFTQRGYFKKQEVELPVSQELERKMTSITFASLYWSKQSQRLPTCKTKRIKFLKSMAGMSTNFRSSLLYHKLALIKC
jgi:hypothetical protein